MDALLAALGSFSALVEAASLSVVCTFSIVRVLAFHAQAGSGRVAGFSALDSAATAIALMQRLWRRKPIALILTGLCCSSPTSSGHDYYGTCVGKASPITDRVALVQAASNLRVSSATRRSLTRMNSASNSSCGLLASSALAQRIQASRRLRVLIVVRVSRAS